jgi:hypothetical protein
MWKETPRDEIVEWDAAPKDQLPTNEQRKKLVRDTLRYANLFPPGPEQSCLQRIAQTLAFFEDDAVLSDQYHANQPSTSLGGSPSIVDGPDRVVGVRLPVSLFEAIGRWAKAESLSPSDAIRTLLTRGLNP